MTWLAKAQFQRLKADGSNVGAPLEVQFNPTEFTLNKGAQIAEIPVVGIDGPMLQYVRGQAETLTMDLFFDTTDEGGTGGDAKPVTDKTDPFYQLIKINPDTRALPVVLISWGGDSFPGGRSYASTGPNRYGFKGVVETVRQRFTMFSSLGLPLRATISISVKEYKTLAEMAADIQVADDSRAAAQTVEEGQTMSDLAHEQGDEANWREAAEANDNDDPENLEAGSVINMPPLHITA